MTVRKTPLSLGAITSLLVLVVGCGESEEETWSRIGRAIAPELSDTNGVPTAVLDEFWCHDGIEPCRERDGHVNASRVDAAPLVSSFADARGIPVVRFESATPPVCEWSADDGEASGLWAEFIAPPEVAGDTARVELATGCSEDGAAFSQVHEFTLRREDGTWTVVERRLTSIT